MDASATPSGELTRDINILPLIDVLLVMIIIYLLQFRDLLFIPAQVPPPARQAPAVTTQIVLQLRADGSLAINDQPVPESQLETMLHGIYDDRPVKLLFLQAAEARRYDEVIRLMDRARGAGVKVLGWVPRAARGR